MDNNEDSDEEFEIEAIVNHRDGRNGREYLVKWLGWTDRHNSWVKVDELQHAQDTLRRYETLHPKKSTTKVDKAKCRGRVLAKEGRL